MLLVDGAPCLDGSMHDTARVLVLSTSAIRSTHNQEAVIHCSSSMVSISVRTRHWQGEKMEPVPAGAVSRTGNP